MRISNYPTDTITGSELILATDINTSTQKYKTVNFTADTLKTYVLGALGGTSNSVLFEGATSNDIETTLTTVDPTGSDKTIYLPNATGYLPVLAVPSTTVITATPEELNILDTVTATAVELNILDASAGNIAVTSDVANSSGNVASGADHYKLSHTLTLAANLADDAEHADITINNNKVLATSVVLANTSVNANIDVHTVVAGSFKIRITNKSGGNLNDDSTMVINYRIL